MMCLARERVSGPGVTPDLEASEEVLSWMWMLRGGRLGWEERREVRPWERRVAFLAESTEDTRKRLGMLEARDLHLSGGVGS